jgi:hypothetical protein
MSIKFYIWTGLLSKLSSVGYTYLRPLPNPLPKGVDNYLDLNLELSFSIILGLTGLEDTSIYIVFLGIILFPLR